MPAKRTREPIFFFGLRPGTQVAGLLIDQGNTEGKKRKTKFEMSSVSLPLEMDTISYEIMIMSLIIFNIITFIETSLGPWSRGAI
jgi:hypothetical protein